MLADAGSSFSGGGGGSSELTQSEDTAPDGTVTTAAHLETTADASSSSLSTYTQSSRWTQQEGGILVVGLSQTDGSSSATSGSSGGGSTDQRASYGPGGGTFTSTGSVAPTTGDSSGSGSTSTYTLVTSTGNGGTAHSTSTAETGYQGEASSDGPGTTTSYSRSTWSSDWQTSDGGGSDGGTASDTSTAPYAYTPPLTGAWLPDWHPGSPGGSQVFQFGPDGTQVFQFWHGLQVVSPPDERPLPAMGIWIFPPLDPNLEGPPAAAEEDQPPRPAEPPRPVPPPPRTWGQWVYWNGRAGVELLAVPGQAVANRFSGVTGVTVDVDYQTRTGELAESFADAPVRSTLDSSFGAGRICLMKTTSRDRWKQLGQLLDRVDRRGIPALSVAEVKHLCRLYRHVTIDLSRARAGGDDPELIGYLNGLAARAHGQVYAVKRTPVRPLLGFLLTGFPRLVRRRALAVVVSMGVFLLATLASFSAVLRDPETAYSLFDESVVEYENIRLEKQQGEYRGNFTFELSHSPMVAVAIIGNNVRVAILAFAVGAILCLPGVILLVYNGLMLGTLTGLVWRAGYAGQFYGLILTHGVIELTAICISGAAGLLIGWAVIAPGRRSRQAALAAAAVDGLGLLGGSVAMLVVAGVIEAYVTPHCPATVRWAVAGGSAVLLAVYFGLVGREPARGRGASSAGAPAVKSAPAPESPDTSR